MSREYKIHNPEGVYFITPTVVAWKQIIFLIILSFTIYILPIKLFGQNGFEPSTSFEDRDSCLYFEYSTKLTYTRDNEIFKPDSFEILLPKKIKYWEINNSSNFGFYYNSRQVIFIKTDLLELEKNQKDTIYIPTFYQLTNFIENDIITNSDNKWDIKKIPILKRRNHLIIKNEDTTILLLNIKEKNVTNFKKTILYFNCFQ